MKKFIIALFVAMLCMSFTVPANADPDPVGDSSQVGDEDGDGDGAGSSTVACGTAYQRFSYVDLPYWGAVWTYRVSARLFAANCYDSGPGYNYVRVTHVGAAYTRLGGGPTPCDPTGVGTTNRFEVNIGRFDGTSWFTGIDPSVLTVDCSDQSDYVWRDIPNRAIYPGEDHCWDWAGTVIVNNNDDKNFSASPAPCVAHPE